MYFTQLKGSDTASVRSGEKTALVAANILYVASSFHLQLANCNSVAYTNKFVLILSLLRIPYEMCWALRVCVWVICIDGDACHRIDSLPYEHRMLQFMAIQSVILPMKCNEKTNKPTNKQKRNLPTAIRRANGSTLNAIEIYI